MQVLFPSMAAIGGISDDDAHEGVDGPREAKLDRRQFLLRAGVAGVAGAVAYTVHKILAVWPAYAAGGSAPPARETPQVSGTKEERPTAFTGDVLGESVAKTDATASATGTGSEPVF